MAEKKLSPRQRMINMMYLVLTALLALNVSKAVLDSFFEVNSGIERTTTNFNSKNGVTYDAFVEADANNPGKWKEVKDQAFSVKTSADEISLMIQNMKYDLVYEADNGRVVLGNPRYALNDKGKLIEEGTAHTVVLKDSLFSTLDSELQKKQIAYLNNKKDRSASQKLFLDPKKQKKKQQAYILSDKISEYKELLISFSNGNQALVANIEQACDVSNKKRKGAEEEWEEYNFLDMPSVGALTILSKIQSDMRNVESDVIEYLIKNIDAKSLKFTGGAEAIYVPKSNFVLQGDSFHSEIFITARNDQNPDIYVGEFDSIPGEIDPDGNPTFKMRGTLGVDYEEVRVVNGKGMYAKRTRAEGNQKWGGLIAMKTETGTKFYPFAGEYLVAAKTVVVSPTFMNVLYVKVDNEIKISVPGYSASQVTARAKNGSCTPVNKNKGEWIVNPDKENKKNTPFIQLFVTEDDGKQKAMGWVEFRILDVPDPEAQAAGIADGQKLVSRSELRGAQMLKANLGEDFLLDPKAVAFGIKEFEVSYTNSNGTFRKKNEGATFNKDVEQAIATTAAGGTITFMNIKARRRGYKAIYEPNDLTFIIK